MPLPSLAPQLPPPPPRPVEEEEEEEDEEEEGEGEGALCRFEDPAPMSTLPSSSAAASMSIAPPTDPPPSTGLHLSRFASPPCMLSSLPPSVPGPSTDDDDDDDCEKKAEPKDFKISAPRFKKLLPPRTRSVRWRVDSFWMV